VRQYAFARAGDIVMHCGVAICGECYEVGSEVVQALTGRAADAAERVDLRALLVHQARALGIQDITVSPWCSAHDRERFFSHRASGGSDGRMVAYLGRRLA
jgi:copper oxidase (laccase) domain-containing protein